MPEEIDEPSFSLESEENQESNGRLYALAMDAIKDCISVYLELVEKTKGFNALTVEHLKTTKERWLSWAELEVHSTMKKRRRKLS